jgi:hypothetical protein
MDTHHVPLRQMMTTKRYTRLDRCDRARTHTHINMIYIHTHTHTLTDTHTHTHTHTHTVSQVTAQMEEERAQGLEEPSSS